jgi:uncharacterized protein YndB with AHSA1/START domain
VPDRPSLTLERRLDAVPALVFRAWTRPEQLVRWWGPGETQAVQAELDVRVGGRFRVRFRTADGEEHEVGGVYREVVPDRRLVFTWAWHTTPERESLVTVAMEDDGRGTLMTLHHEQFFDAAARDRHRHGWSGALDKLVALFAQPMSKSA